MNHNKEHKFESDDFLELLKKLEQTKPSDLNQTIDKEQLDDFDKEAIEGALFYSDSHSFSDTQKTIESAINQKINKNQNGKTKRIIWFSAAASLVLIIGISVFLFYKEKKDSHSISLLEEQHDVVAKDKMTVTEPNQEGLLKEAELKAEEQKNTNTILTQEKKIIPQNQYKQSNNTSNDLIPGEKDNKKIEDFAANKADKSASASENTVNDESKIATGAALADTKQEMDADMSTRAESETVVNSKKSKVAKEEAKVYSATTSMPAATSNQLDKLETQNTRNNIISFAESMYKGGMNALVKDLKQQLEKESIDVIPNQIKIIGSINQNQSLVIKSIECFPTTKSYNQKQISKIISKLPGWTYNRDYENQIINISLDL